MLNSLTITRKLAAVGLAREIAESIAVAMVTYEDDPRKTTDECRASLSRGLVADGLKEDFAEVLAEAIVISHREGYR